MKYLLEWLFTKCSSWESFMANRDLENDTYTRTQRKKRLNRNFKKSSQDVSQKLWIFPPWKFNLETFPFKLYISWYHSNYTFLDTRPPNVLHLNHLSDSILPVFNKRMETLVGNCDVKATLLGMKSAYSACQECIKRVKPHFPYPSVFCTKMTWRAETNIQANVNAQKYYFYCSGLPKSNNSALQKPL